MFTRSSPALTRATRVAADEEMWTRSTPRSLLLRWGSNERAIHPGIIVGRRDVRIALSSLNGVVQKMVRWLRAHAPVAWPRRGPEAAVRSGLASEDSRDPTEQPGRVSPRFGGLHATLRANLGCSQALCFPRQWPHLLDRGSGTHQHWYGRAGGSLFRRRPASSSRRKGQRMGVPTATGASGLLLTLAAGPPRERSVVQRADGGARSS